ncbi:hypothetical protein Hanom_Chr07g00599711 [Helianthus anomalus]
MLSHPSVGRDPKSCLRFWSSFVYLRISPLHTKFHSPLSHSSELVSRAFRHFLATFTFNPRKATSTTGQANHFWNHLEGSSYGEMPE